MKKVITVLLLLCSTSVFAQRRPVPAEEAKNVAYFELAGNAVGYSLNYERMLGKSFSGRIGLAAYGAVSGDDGGILTIIPVMINFVPGKNNVRAELGLGRVFINGTTGSGSENIDKFVGGAYTGTIGFRYQKQEGGLFLKAGLTPIWTGDGEGIVWFGAAIGASF